MACYVLWNFYARISAVFCLHSIRNKLVSHVLFIIMIWYCCHHRWHMIALQANGCMFDKRSNIPAFKLLYERVCVGNLCCSLDLLQRGVRVAYQNSGPKIICKKILCLTSAEKETPRWPYPRNDSIENMQRIQCAQWYFCRGFDEPSNARDARLGTCAELASVDSILPSPQDTITEQGQCVKRVFTFPYCSFMDPARYKIVIRITPRAYPRTYQEQYCPARFRRRAANSTKSIQSKHNDNFTTQFSRPRVAGVSWRWFTTCLAVHVHTDILSHLGTQMTGTHAQQP